jgi:predicted enzyme related to lactoylglutathione lyase
VAIEVEDFEDALQTLEKANAPVLAEKIESPTCRMAIVQDPDGNKIIVHKLKTDKRKGDVK